MDHDLPRIDQLAVVYVQALRVAHPAAVELICVRTASLPLRRLPTLPIPKLAAAGTLHSIQPGWARRQVVKDFGQKTAVYEEECCGDNHISSNPLPSLHRPEFEKDVWLDEPGTPLNAQQL